MGEYALTGAHLFEVTAGLALIAVAILFLLFASPNRLSRRLSGMPNEGSFKRFARWTGTARGFWVLVVVLAGGLPSEIAKVFSAHSGYLKFGFIAFPVLNIVVIIQLVRLRSWAKAQPESSLM